LYREPVGCSKTVGLPSFRENVVLGSQSLAYIYAIAGSVAVDDVTLAAAMSRR
jgi:hypothetical protein